MTLTDWIQALSSAAIVVLTIFLWNLARHQTELLSASVQIARQASEAARESAELARQALIGVQRPFLVVSVGEFTINPPTKTVHFEEFTATVTIKNIGSQTALIVDCAAQLEPRISPYAPPKPGVDELDSTWSGVDVGEGTYIPVASEISFEVSRLMVAERGEIAENFNGLKAALYLFGIVVYEDPIGIRRELGFTQGWLNAAAEGGFSRCYADGRNYDRVVGSHASPIRRSAPRIA